MARSLLEEAPLGGAPPQSQTGAARRQGPSICLAAREGGVFGIASARTRARIAHGKAACAGGMRDGLVLCGCLLLV